MDVKDPSEVWSGRKEKGTEVFIKSSHPNKRLHGYVGTITDVNGPECTMKFALKVGNEISEVKLPLRDVGLCPK
jgi:hypothetical protein